MLANSPLLEPSPVKSILNTAIPFLVSSLAILEDARKSFEQVKQSQLIRITAFINPQAPLYLGQINYTYGKENLNNPRALKITRLVAEKVFYEWWRPPFALPHLMWACEETTGTSVIEGQGRLSRGRSWCLIYGTKGKEEQEKVKEVKDA